MGPDAPDDLWGALAHRLEGIPKARADQPLFPTLHGPALSLAELRRLDQGLGELPYDEAPSPASQELLRRHTWPGNVRELRNAVERGIAMARGRLILPEDLPASMRQVTESDNQMTATPENGSGTLTETVAEAERGYLITLLRQNEGNVASSARQAGMSRQGLHKLLKKHGVDAADYRK